MSARALKKLSVLTVVEVSGGVAKHSGDRGGGGGERRSVGGRGRVVGGDWWRYPANTSWQRIGDRRLCPRSRLSATATFCR